MKRQIDFGYRKQNPDLNQLLNNVHVKKYVYLYFIEYKLK